MNAPVLHAAQDLLERGLSIAFIRADGSKAAAHPWRMYQHQAMSPEELMSLAHRLHYQSVGLAILTGQASGSLEVIDFDTLELVSEWEMLVEDLIPGLLATLPMVQTPRPGRHLYYRCPTIEGNQKLAQVPDESGLPQTIIETRGLGGYVLIPPSPAACHPSHRRYEVIQGSLLEIPTITLEARDLLLNAARTFHTYVMPGRTVGTRPSRGGLHLGMLPGDLFAAAVSWPEILEPYGWTCVGARGDLCLWKRPGKAHGHSATTSFGDHDLLYVFSSNAAPFEPLTSYTKFGAFALLAHGGDFSRAAHALMLQGYRASRLTPSERSRLCVHS